MAEGRIENVKLTRTSRSYRQDAENAMGSDPMRAIVELVTNADDAYEAVPTKRKGKIRVEVERHRGSPTVLRVLDRARGMTQFDMKERLLTLGARTSGFEKGAEIRGLFGRGAKDVVHFGPVRWESKCKGEHTQVAILYESGATDDATITSLAPVERRDTGTSVTLEIQPRFTIPQEITLMRKLRRHYALRPILQDRRNRELTLNGNKVIWEPPRGKLLDDRKRVAIPGYDEQECIISISECDESLDDNEDWEYWQHSILIKSGRAAYEIFSGGKFSRGQYAPYLGRLFGTADVPGINSLIREYEECIEKNVEPPDNNNSNLVRRDRGGLVSEHPFVKALYKAVESALEPHLRRLRKEAERESTARTSANLRRKLDKVGKVFADYLDEVGESGTGNDPEIGLTLIPSTCVVEPGKTGRVVIRYLPRELLDELPLVTVQRTDGGVLEDVKHPPVTLELASRANGLYFSQTYQVPGRDEGSISLLDVNINGLKADAFIEWKLREMDPIDKVMFDSASYRVKDGLRRVIRLLAPWETIAGRDMTPRIDLQGDPSIMLVGQSRLLFNYDSRLHAGVCVAQVQGSGVGSKSRLIGTVGKETAEAEVRVIAPGSSGIRIEIVKNDKVPQRAWLSSGTLYINATDPSLKSYLGPEKNSWPGQETVHFNTMLAEILVSTVVRHKLQRKYEQPYDTARLFREFLDESGKLLPRIHKALVPGTELRSVVSW